MNRIWIVGSLVVASIAYNFYQSHQINNLEILARLDAGREAINDDNFRDVLMNTMNQNALENQKSQGRIEGILAVIGKQKPDETEWSAIWHEGYNRGMNQNKEYADSSYQRGREDALKDAKEGKTGQIFQEGEKHGYLVGYHKAQEDQALQVCPVSGGYVNSTTKKK